MSDEFDAERFPGNFYRGMIMRLDRVRGRGAVRSHQGREVLFEFPFVEIAGAAVFLCAVGVVAAYLPGRRAASIDPMQALRTE